MGYLDKVVDISELTERNLWVVWGKSNSGKTTLIGSFPKPMIYIMIGDNGAKSIKHVDGIDVIEVGAPSEVVPILEEVYNSKKYKTCVIDTFSLMTQVWIDQNVKSKKKKMTQQLWGDLKDDTDEIIRMASKLSAKEIVVLTCHEATESIEGYEDEVTPDVRPSVTKGSRTYLEGMANFGVHTTVISQETEAGTTEVHACHVGKNPYYWTKAQISPDIKLPKTVKNPTYDKLMKYYNGEVTKKSKKKSK